MAEKPTRDTVEDIGTRIYTVRGHRVLTDLDLANIYGVTTKRLNEQVKRNAKRFPDDFMFRLTLQEWTDLRSQNATSSSVDRPQNATGSVEVLKFNPHRSAAEAGRLESRLPALTAALLGVHFLCRERKGAKKELKDFLFVLFFVRFQRKVPKEKPPSSSACGFPHKRHVHGGGTNSHIWALKQRAAGTRAHAFCSASLLRVFRT